MQYLMLFWFDNAHKLNQHIKQSFYSEKFQKVDSVYICKSPFVMIRTDAQTLQHLDETIRCSVWFPR